MEVAEPATFVPDAPLVLKRLWNRLEALSSAVSPARRPGRAAAGAASHAVDLDLRSSRLRGRL